MERRIAAIFAADMVGYSRLMEADETGTLERQKVHFAELILPNIEKHNGRIVKLMGDGLLGEFASVVDAVQCAVTIQRAMALIRTGSKCSTVRSGRTQTILFCFSVAQWRGSSIHPQTVAR